jgi:hypothetical protein
MPPPELKVKPRTDWRFGRLEWKFFLTGLALIVTAAILAVINPTGNVWAFVDALALAVGTAFSLAGAMARVTRDISMRLDAAQQAAEAMEDRISEQLSSLAHSIGVDPPPPPTTPRVPRPGPWAPFSTSRVAASAPRAEHFQRRRRAATSAGLLLLLALAGTAILHGRGGPTGRQHSDRLGPATQKPRLPIPLKSFRDVAAMRLLRSCALPVGREGGWLWMGCTDLAGNNLNFSEVHTPDPISDVRPGPPSGCLTPSTGGASVDRGPIHLTCSVGYGVTTSRPWRYTTSIQYEWWYRSFPSVHAILNVVRYTRAESSVLPNWPRAYKLWLRDIAALRPPSHYIGLVSKSSNSGYGGH